MSFAVGVEAGGSFTQIAVINVESQEIVHIKRYARESNRYVLGLEKSLGVMHECVQESLKDAGVQMKDVMQIGITASGFNASDPQILSFFQKLDYPKLIASHDTDGPAVAFLAQHPEKNCCIMICGTGSASKVFGPKGSRLLGAFGHALNESNCGYDLVHQFVNTVIEEFDVGNYEHKQLYQMFAEFEHISDDYRSNDLLDLFYGQNKRKIAGFAKVMSEHADIPLFR